MTEEYDPTSNSKFSEYQQPAYSYEQYNETAASSYYNFPGYEYSGEPENKELHSENITHGMNGTIVVPKMKNRKDSDEGKIFIGGLSWDTTDEALYIYFAKYGKIVDSVVMKDASGHSRGFAFVTYEDPAVLDAVLAERHVIDDKQVDPKPAIPREAQVKSEKMFVGQLPDNVTEKEIQEYFQQFGAIIDVAVMYESSTGQSRGFGFVTYESAEGLAAALEHQPHILAGSTLETTRAMPKAKSHVDRPKRSRDTSFRPRDRDRDRYRDKPKRPYRGSDQPRFDASQDYLYPPSAGHGYEPPATTTDYSGYYGYPPPPPTSYPPASDYNAYYYPPPTAYNYAGQSSIPPYNNSAASSTPQNVSPYYSSTSYTGQSAPGLYSSQSSYYSAPHHSVPPSSSTYGIALPPQQQPQQVYNQPPPIPEPHFDTGSKFSGSLGAKTLGDHGRDRYSSNIHAREGSDRSENRRSQTSRGRGGSFRPY